MPVVPPVTTPVDDPTVATAVALLLHVPPLTVEVRVDVPLITSDEVPDIVPAEGNELTVTTLVLTQPAGVV